MPRFAAIDIGTNSVLLLVAERTANGAFVAVEEKAEITRLGKGVDQSKRLGAEGIEQTVAAVEAFVARAKSLGAQKVVASATSAARDAQNGADFLAAVKARAGLEVQIISGDLEAKLSFAAVYADFARGTSEPLLCLDIGGGSTEIIFGKPAPRREEIGFRQSFDVGSVRLTERFLRGDPPSAAEQDATRAHLRQVFSASPAPPPGALLVGVAGTVTTLLTLLHRIDPYDAARVQGGVISLQELRALRERLFSLPVEHRRELPGLQPKRADVIPAGALILEVALETLQLETCTVSDRGLRWGLLAHTFGGAGALT
jgi:exopolyphosphatase / guanosine-5'-triphosphate,3'-diphosphate pyrophosphatase